MMTDRARVTIAITTLVVVAVLAGIVGYLAGDSGREASSDPDGTGSGGPVTQGLDAGPAQVVDGIPIGFEQSDEGALAAAVTWMPMLHVTPDSERVDGIEQVMANGLDLPVQEGLTFRFALIPLAGRVSMASPDEGQVELVVLMVDSSIQAGTNVAPTAVAVELAWDDSADDWRISAIEPSGASVDLSAQELAGYRTLWPMGATLGAPLADEVPGE